MKNILFTSAILVFFGFSSCEYGQEKTETIVLKTPEINIESIVVHANVTRKSIESMLSRPVEIKTAELREKIKQKWEKIHFYTKDGKVIRIKTYAHPSISKRSEEFYLENEQLILAVVEDNGENGKDEDNSEIDKLYYYLDDKLVKEIKNSSENEYAIKDSDGEELLQEMKEYLEIYRKSQL